MSAVRVRIAVAVDAQGQWCARGNPFARSDDWNARMARIEVSPGATVYILTAELPIPGPPPEPTEIPATVEVEGSG